MERIHSVVTHGRHAESHLTLLLFNLVQGLCRVQGRHEHLGVLYPCQVPFAGKLVHLGFCLVRNRVVDLFGRLLECLQGTVVLGEVDGATQNICLLVKGPDVLQLALELDCQRLKKSQVNGGATWKTYSSTMKWTARLGEVIDVHDGRSVWIGAK